MFNLFKPKGRDRKLMVIGLDCAAPELVFDKYKDELPTLRRIYENSVYGELESCIPAITVPAWSSMMSSKDPGTLGVYGFRNRSDYTYDNQFIATGNYIKEKRVWDYLGEAGKQVVLVGVPQTFPVQPVSGVCITDFLTPTLESGFTYPTGLADKVLSLAPRYQVDVKNFRTPDKDWLLQQIWDMTEMRFEVLNYLQDNQPWDYFMWVEMGVDRMHHGLWSYMDPQHRRHQPGNKYQNAIKDYYQLIDAQLDKMLGKIDDDTLVLVVSDHGGKKMEGGICVNEWLWRNGYLFFEQNPPEDLFDPSGRRILTPFAKLDVDWSKTRAWGDGGYYGRVYINVEGREPHGIVRREAYETVRDELIGRFQAIPGPDGQPLGTVCYKPQEIYHKVRNVAPDLIVYWGDLDWRSVGSLGHGSFYTFENDTGPDDANHARNGLFMLYDPQSQGHRQQVTGRQLMDVAPTLLELMGIKPPPDMQGKRLFE